MRCCDREKLIKGGVAEENDSVDQNLWLAKQRQRRNTE
jgi:hypothetical protein